MSKVIFYQAVLVPLTSAELNEILKGQPLHYRMENPDGSCPTCGEKKWYLYPKESSLFKNGYKPYIECLKCGYTSHL